MFAGADKYIRQVVRVRVCIILFPDTSSWFNMYKNGVVCCVGNMHFIRILSFADTIS